MTVFKLGFQDKVPTKIKSKRGKASRVRGGARENAYLIGESGVGISSVTPAATRVFGGQVRSNGAAEC